MWALNIACIPFEFLKTNSFLILETNKKKIDTKSPSLLNEKDKNLPKCL